MFGHLKGWLLVLVTVSVLADRDAGAQAPATKILLAEDFEATAAGEIPQGYTKNGAVAVVDDVAHTGKKSLKISAAERGPRRITKKGEEIAALGGSHWGRMYFKVQLPAPVPPMPTEGRRAGVIHSTLVGGMATSPQHDDPIEVRVVDTVESAAGTFQFIYNVQPRKRPEFATGSKSRFRYTDEWTLAEWFVDHATQSYRFFVNGEEVTEIAINKGAGNFEKCEIPAVFESLSFGWNNYQSAGAGFVVWIDDIALAKERIGGTSPAGGDAKK